MVRPRDVFDNSDFGIKSRQATVREAGVNTVDARSPAGVMKGHARLIKFTERILVTENVRPALLLRVSMFTPFLFVPNGNDHHLQAQN